jgi:hypothetical protein
MGLKGSIDGFIVHNSFLWVQCPTSALFLDKNPKKKRKNTVGVVQRVQRTERG